MNEKNNNTNKILSDTATKDEEKLYCRFCFNSRIYTPSDDPFEKPLTDENDFGAFCVGDCDKDYCLMINTGYGKPQNITVQRWNEKSHMWEDIGIYKPKHCPECGRLLDEYDKQQNRGRAMSLPQILQRKKEL